MPLHLLGNDSAMNVICLANSYKHHDRCIAGIESTSGQWVRPVSDCEDGRIPKNDRFINVEKITLLDRVDIPINNRQKQGHEIENFRYTRGSWRITGKSHVSDLLRYCESDLLYPNYKQAIPYTYLKQNAPVRSLQLIEVKSLICLKNHWDKWKAVILDEQYQLMDVELSITDPMILSKLEQGESISAHALLCLSLGQPWQKTANDELLCYRLIAGVIELLPELEIILTEMNRIRWTTQQGQQYLGETFGKKSRYQLTQAEAIQFLNYLRSQP